jgi:hypothetical protein
MKTTLRTWLRDKVLTEDERTLLQSPRETVLRALCSREEWRILSAVRAAKPYVDMPPVTDSEQRAWASTIRGPLGMKVDAAMINWLHERAQAALMESPETLVAQAKFALGCRAGWEMGKSILRLVAAKSDTPEEADHTAAADLEHLKP